MGAGGGGDMSSHLPKARTCGRLASTQRAPPCLTLRSAMRHGGHLQVTTTETQDQGCRSLETGGGG